MPKVTSISPSNNLRTFFLTCGVLAPLVYIATDLVAGLRYPGYSFTAQTVSELFAIGAPTSHLVVPMFSLASLLFLAFAFGVWQSSGGRRLLRVLGLMITCNAVNSLVAPWPRVREFAALNGLPQSHLILTGLQPGERAITLLRNRFNGFVEGKQIKPLKRFSVQTFPLSTGLKPGENEMTFEASKPHLNP